MNYDQFENLENKIKNKDFFNNYKGLSTIAFYLSFLGNLFSIGFAYFHVNKMFLDAVLDPTANTFLVCTILSLSILTGLELIKRFIFDKFTTEFIKQKFTFKGSESTILAFISILLISASFYLSLNGAKDFSSRNTEIKDKVEATISGYGDSLKTLYDGKISKLDSASNFLSQKKLDYEQKSEEAETARDKKYYRQRIKENDELIVKNDIKVKELKSEYDKELSQYELKVSSKGNAKIQTNQGNSIKFVIWSTIFEFIILFGIFFNNFFVIKSHGDYREKINKDPKYKTFNLYNQILSVLYNKDTKAGDSIPVKTEIIKILRINNVDISQRELDDALKVITHVGVLQKRGPKKVFKTDLESARELIKNHLKID